MPGGKAKARISVHKFTSCDGCQLTFLDLEESLLPLTEHVDIAYFAEASSDYRPGPYDISFCEGSVTTHHEEERLKAIRADSTYVVSLGVCATHGGIQGLRHYGRLDDMVSYVYPRPDWVAQTRPESMPFWHYIKVDFQLQGCPIDRHQLLETTTSLLIGKRPYIPTESVCLECKRKGNICVLVAKNIPCMGPVTHIGCGALCPSYDRDCYACFGPMDDPHPQSYGNELQSRGLEPGDVVRRFLKITSFAEPFEKEAARYGQQAHQGRLVGPS